MWSHGNYVAAKWRTVSHFCKQCFESRVKQPLVGHADGCGCEIVLRVYAGKRPAWLSLGTTEACRAEAVA